MTQNTRNSTTHSLTIAIEAQLLPGGQSGGIEQVLIGLVRALGRLDDGPEEYVIVGPPERPNWLAPYLGPNQRIVPGPSTWVRYRRTKRVLGPLAPAVGRLGHKILGKVWSVAGVPMAQVRASNGFYEGLGAEVIHFPYQMFVRSNLPSVFNPHDLQHLHHPEFFPPEAIRWRETIYTAGCRSATSVVVASHWAKRDVVQQYAVRPDRIKVIPWAPATVLYDNVTEEFVEHIAERYDLQRPFAFYPAATWQHKNHIRLLEAIAFLRDQSNLRAQLVCTGHQNTFWPRIEARLHALDLQPQVRFLGVIPANSLRALYRLAQFVVLPTLFEGWGFPLFEAFAEGVPVACSGVNALREHAGDAALLFDPMSVESIAQAIQSLATERSLRATLAKRGRQRVRSFSWGRTARAYRAVYRQILGSDLSREDEHLLAQAAYSTPNAGSGRIAPTARTGAA